MDTPDQAPGTDALNRDGLWSMPPGPPHEEQHLAQIPLMRDAVAGAADGVILPFALAAGLSSVVATHPPIVVAGLAAAAAGAVATGLGGYLAARSEADHHAAERRREEAETVDYADRERWEVAAILHRYGVRGHTLRLAVDSICADTRRWVDFMMRFELDLKEPEPQRAVRSAATTGIAHLAGGFVPIAPYLLMDDLRAALTVSCSLAVMALAGLGWLKARGSGLPPLRGAIQALATGFAASGLAVLAARAVGV